MDGCVTHRREALALGFLLLVALCAAPGEAAPVVVETFGNTDPFAQPGTKNTTLINVLVINPADGSTLNSLGSNVARDDLNGITLPTGWTLQDGVVPAGGCGFTPTEFVNLGAGYYAIRVKPNVSNALCGWNEGDYPYVVHIDVGGFNGSGLGVIESRRPNPAP